MSTESVTGLSSREAPSKEASMGLLTSGDFKGVSVGLRTDVVPVRNLDMLPKTLFGVMAVLRGVTGGARGVSEVAWWIDLVGVIGGVVLACGLSGESISMVSRGGDWVFGAARKLICGRGGVGGRAMNLEVTPGDVSSSSSSSSPSRLPCFAPRISLAGVGWTLPSSTLVLTGVVGQTGIDWLTGNERKVSSPSRLNLLFPFPASNAALRFNPSVPRSDCACAVVCRFNILSPKLLFPAVCLVFAEFSLSASFPVNLSMRPSFVLEVLADAADDRRVMDRVRAAKGMEDLLADRVRMPLGGCKVVSGASWYTLRGLRGRARVMSMECGLLAGQTSDARSRGGRLTENQARGFVPQPEMF